MTPVTTGMMVLPLRHHHVGVDAPNQHRDHRVQAIGLLPQKLRDIHFASPDIVPVVGLSCKLCTAILSVNRSAVLSTILAPG
jgi:hypothetical protein